MQKSEYKQYFDLQKIVNDIKKYSSNFDKEIFLKAFDFADRAHKGQMRKDNVTPYIVHPVKVVELLTHLRADEDMLVAAFLHDVPEDTDHDIKEVKELFGERVAFLVDGITKLSKVQYKHNMPERQVESLKKLFLHSAKDPCVILIKLADRLHNMQTLHFISDSEKRLRIAGETLEIYVPIANLLGLQELKFELEDLCFKHLFPTEYKELKSKIKSSKEKHSKLLSKFVTQLRGLLKENKIDAKVYTRTKNLFSIYKKLCSEGKSVDHFEDRVALRIIVKNVSQCYQSLGIVHSRFTPNISRFKDYIANPKQNGYQSLHTAIFGPEGLLTEIQIKTEEMHIEAEYGIAANFILKKKDNISKDKRYSWVSKVIELEKTEKNSGDFLENLKLDVLRDRIVIFTTKGDVIDLPEGASAIDLAYAIHTDVGDHAVRAEINGKIMPITTVLKSRATVKILRSEELAPMLSWLSFSKTNIARERIKMHLRKIGRGHKIKEGKRILQKEFDIAEMGHLQRTNFKKLNIKLEKELGKNIENLEALFVALGEGSIRAQDVVKLVRKDKARSIKSKKIKVSVKVVAKNRFGLLREISEVFYKYASDMSYFKGSESSSQENAYFTARILVDDLGHVGKIFAELEQVEGVIHVYRISIKGFYLTIIITIFTGLIWISHPLILKALISSVVIENRILFNIIVDFGIFSLFFMVLYLTFILKDYYPLARKKKTLWIASFTVPALALLVLLIEIFYFNLQLSLLAILIEVAMIYVYLGLSFRNFRKFS